LLVQEIELQLVRPPVLVCRAAAGSVFVNSARYWALVTFTHNACSFGCVNCRTALL
jgi:hypothetical protein